MDKRTTIKNALVLTLSGLAVKAMGFFFRIPLGRLLTASGMGDYSPAYEIYSFALLFSTAGLPVAVAKMIAERNAVGELDNSKKYSVFQGCLWQRWALPVFLCCLYSVMKYRAL